MCPFYWIAWYIAWCRTTRVQKFQVWKWVQHGTLRQKKTIRLNAYLRSFRNMYHRRHAAKICGGVEGNGDRETNRSRWLCCARVSGAWLHPIWLVELFDKLQVERSKSPRMPASFTFPAQFSAFPDIAAYPSQPWMVKQETLELIFRKEKKKTCNARRRFYRLFPAAYNTSSTAAGFLILLVISVQ